MTCDNGKIQFQINCASREFHVYRNIWSPKIGQNLVVRQEVGNDHDPFAMSAGANIPGKLTNFDMVDTYLVRLAAFVIILSITEGLLRREYENHSTDHLVYLMVVWRFPLLSIIKKSNSTRKVFENMKKKGKRALY